MVQDIWLLPLPEIPFEQLLDRDGHVMTANEVGQLQSKRLPKGKHMYAFTRIALRYVLSRYETHVAPGQWQFTRQGAGKPTIASPETALRFNLTHADDLLVIAVCDHADVGVDVEARHRDVDVMALSRRYYQPSEVLALEQQAEEDQRRLSFLTLWTLKEAAVKATGQGLSKALRNFNFDLQPPQQIVVARQQAGQVTGAGLPVFWTFAWRDYLLSCAKLSASAELASGNKQQIAENVPSGQASRGEWRCFSWEWSDVGPLPATPELLWRS